MTVSSSTRQGMSNLSDRRVATPPLIREVYFVEKIFLNVSYKQFGWFDWNRWLWEENLSVEESSQWNNFLWINKITQETQDPVVQSRMPTASRENVRMKRIERITLTLSASSHEDFFFTLRFVVYFLHHFHCLPNWNCGNYKILVWFAHFHRSRWFHNFHFI